MDGLYSGKALVTRLQDSDFVAIKNGNLKTIALRCGCSKHRSIGTYGLQQFGYEAIIHMGVVKIPHIEPYLFIGPAEKANWSIPQKDLENLLLAKLQARSVERNAREDHAFTKELEAIIDDTSEPSGHIFANLEEWSDAMEDPIQAPLYKARTPVLDTDISRNEDGVEKAWPQGSQNEDGGVIRLGKGIWHKTYYCGEVKYPTSWIPLTSRYMYPPDKTCGPDGGMQCIACKRLQDSHVIGDMSQDKCYNVF
ncbi:hypothetical protein T484DRAFT_1756097 [Baffinella frigidus]|nr:hypothetical protein T484DRAFT_1756097 [Cryptophyta sp. CCMP2293]